MSIPDVSLSASARHAVVEDVVETILRHYLFPDKANEIAGAIRSRAGVGEYDDVTTPRALADILTTHLREAGHDHHLCVLYPAPPRPASGREQPTLEEREERRRRDVQSNFGFHRVERLSGNVGYLELRRFHAPELAGETTVAAMRLLTHTAAVIVDLRRNGGGEPGQVALLASYFLGPEPVHLWDFRWPVEDRIEQTWTLPYVPGPRYLDRPVYLLTSRQTVSGGESFSYTLKAQGRATVVGEATRGAAYYADGFLIQGIFGLAVSTAQPIDAITGTNWEGSGVIPDIAVSAEEALTIAHAAALRQVLLKLGEASDPASRELRDEAQSALSAYRER